MTDEETSALSAVRLRARIDDLHEEVQGLRSDVRDLVEAWNTAKGLVKMVKVIGALSAALAGFLAALKLGRSL